MCLHPSPIDPDPEETARVARSAFPKGNTYLRMREELGAVFEDEDFAALFPARGKPALPPWRLALVTVMQFAEGLSDRRAADAVRAHRLEVRALSGARRPRLRRLGAMRVPLPPGGARRAGVALRPLA